MPVDTTGPFPADPLTGQRAVANKDDGALFYYPDEPKPGPGTSYSIIQRSSGNTATMSVPESASAPMVTVAEPEPVSVPSDTSTGSPMTVETTYTPSAPVKRPPVKSSSSGGGVSVPWMDIAQGISAAGQLATPALQMQTAMLAARMPGQPQFQFTPMPYGQRPVARDYTLPILGGTALIGLGIVLYYMMKRK